MRSSPSSAARDLTSLTPAWAGAATTASIRRPRTAACFLCVFIIVCFIVCFPYGVNSHFSRQHLKAHVAGKRAARRDNYHRAGSSAGRYIRINERGRDDAVIGG